VRRAGLRAAGVVLLLVAGCGGGGESATREAVVETISPAEAAALLDAASAGLVVLDVRTPDEFAAGTLTGAVNLDYYGADFSARLDALDRSIPYVLFCRTGNRSSDVRETMRALGFLEVHEIGGGIVAWAEAGLPVFFP